MQSPNVEYLNVKGGSEGVQRAEIPSARSFRSGRPAVGETRSRRMMCCGVLILTREAWSRHFGKYSEAATGEYRGLDPPSEVVLGKCRCVRGRGWVEQAARLIDR